MEVPPQFRVGSELAGKYRIDEILAQGGMGMVVLARHLLLDELVAIKFLLPESVENADALARFNREARAAAKIRSEHSVRVHDIGTLEGGHPYLVMEYLDGYDLNVELTQHGPLMLGDALDFFLQACEAVAEAHALGIVHRDLKPANLFLSRRADGSICVKVLDFGISKFSSKDISQSSAHDYGMTQAATVLGSPYYMSPEQIRSAKDADSRSDVWALGVILYELLTGEHPFEGDSLPSLSVAIATQPPRPFPYDRFGVPQPVVDAIFRCLEKDRERRTQTVADLAQQLGPFAPPTAQLSIERIVRVSEGGAFSSRPPSSHLTMKSGPSTIQSQRTQWEFSQTPAKRPKRLRLAALLGVLGLAFALGIGVFFVNATAKMQPAAERQPAITVAAEPTGIRPGLGREVPASAVLHENPSAGSAPPNPTPSAVNPKPTIPPSPGKRPPLSDRRADNAPHLGTVAATAGSATRQQSPTTPHGAPNAGDSLGGRL